MAYAACLLPLLFNPLSRLLCVPHAGPTDPDGIRIRPMYLVSHLTAPKLGVVLLGDAGKLTQDSDSISTISPTSVC